MKSLLAILTMLLLGLVVGCNSVGDGARNPTQTHHSLPSIDDSAIVDKAIDAFAWEDINRDGVRNHGELPLRGVCVYFSNKKELSYNGQSQCQGNEQGVDIEITSENGSATSGDWIIGASSDAEIIERCKAIYINALHPMGYEATTKLVVAGCNAEFGFAKVSIPVQ